MGWLMDIISKPLGYIITICNNLTGNYVLTLILFSFVLQILLLPFAIKQQKNSIKQAKLDPKVKAIRKKYAGRTDQATQQKMNNEVMDLYKRENFNPMGGCLPLLIQMPILFAIYNVVTEPLTYICGYGQDVISAIKEHIYTIMQGSSHAALEKYATFESFDKIREIDIIKYVREVDFGELILENGQKIVADMLPNFTLGPIDFAYSPAEKWNPLIVITILTLVFSVLSQWITRKVSYNPNPDQKNDMSMKMMMWSMPLLSVFIAHKMAAAIGLYWMIRNIYTTLQTVILAKVMPIPRFTEEDYKEAEKEFGVKASKKEKKEQKKVRSLHRIDEEDDEETVQSDEETGKPELRDGVKEEDAPKLKDESDRKAKLEEATEESDETKEESKEQ